MVNYKLRKKLAKDGYLFDGTGFVFNDGPIDIDRYLSSELWKMPKKLKILDL
jgi:hypothetical protein